MADPDGVSEYRLKFTQNIRDGNVVEISLDESLIYASQAWVNENYIRRNEVVDNLTTDDAKKPVSSKQAKNLQDNKLDKTANAVSSSKLETARTISFSGAATGSFNFDGSGNSSCVLALANSGVVASTYGAALKIPVLTVNAKGLITGVSEQNIPIVDDLTTNDGSKPLSARQGKKLQDEKFSKSGGHLSGELTTKPSYLAQNLGDIGAGDNSPIRVPGQLIPLDMTGYIPFVHGSVMTDGYGYLTNVSMGAYRGSNTWDNSGVYIAVGGKDVAPTEAFMFLNGRKISNTAGPIDLAGNASSANKLAIPRNVFGQTFDGSGDVGGTITASTGLVQSDNFHYIDMGRNGLDRMSFYNYGAIFNFIDSQNGNVVARITQNGIDCNAATATKLQTARTIGGVSFDGSANINLPGVNTAGNQNTSGNAASATDCSRSVIAGNGLSGGGALTSDSTVTLGTPGNITATSTNSVTETSHTHNLDVNSLPFLGTGINKRKSIISGTTYTNTGNRPIFVTCSMSGSSSIAASATLDGRMIFSTNSSNQYSQSFVVGVGVSYSFTGNNLVCEEYS